MIGTNAAFNDIQSGLCSLRSCGYRNAIAAMTALCGLDGAGNSAAHKSLEYIDCAHSFSTTEKRDFKSQVGRFSVFAFL